MLRAQDCKIINSGKSQGILKSYDRGNPMFLFISGSVSSTKNQQEATSKDETFSRKLN